MDRHTRKQLKTDKFAQEVGDTFSFLKDHRQESMRYGALALALLVLVGGYFIYSRHEASVRETALADAMRIDEAIIGPADTLTNKAFPTEEAKEAARIKAFSDLASKYHGTTEGSIGQLYIAADYADRGKFAEAEKLYQDVIDSSPKLYRPAAQVALAQVYAADGKVDQAQKLLQELVDHPVDLVSKDAATLDLAEVIAGTKPKDALALVDPLTKSKDVAISKEALTEKSKLTLSSPQN